jgi:hypothetical protein
MNTITAPDGREAKVMENGIVVRAIRSKGVLVTSTTTHDIYEGKPGELIAVVRDA